jgi:hypothetical protein
MLYESVFNEALNTKRSSCEKLSGKIVQSTIAKFELTGEDFFTMDELIKLRRATRERNLQAFYWFFGTFLECVCGRRYWGKQKEKSGYQKQESPVLVAKLSQKCRGIHITFVWKLYWKVAIPASCCLLGWRFWYRSAGRTKKEEGKAYAARNIHKEEKWALYIWWVESWGNGKVQCTLQTCAGSQSMPPAEVIEKELLAFCRS